jgi:hypothetical protein
VQLNIYRIVFDNIIPMNSKILLTTAAIVVAFALIASPLLASDDAFAGKKHKKDRDGNSFKQSIRQSQSNEQNSQSVAGLANIASGNNVNVQVQANTGNNVGAQNND